MPFKYLNKEQVTLGGVVLYVWKLHKALCIFLKITILNCRPIVFLFLNINRLMLHSMDFFRFLRHHDILFSFIFCRYLLSWLNTFLLWICTILINHTQSNNSLTKFLTLRRFSWYFVCQVCESSWFDPLSWRTKAL